MATYYEILEVSKDASPEEIKNKYHFLIQAWHPDKFSVPQHKELANEKTQRIIEAYQTLSNPDKRKLYDKSIVTSLGNKVTRNPSKYHSYKPTRSKPPEEKVKQSPEAYKQDLNEKGIYLLLGGFGGFLGFISGASYIDSNATTISRFCVSTFVTAFASMMIFITSLDHMKGSIEGNSRIFLISLVATWIVAAGIGAVAKNLIISPFLGIGTGLLIARFALSKVKKSF